MVVVLLVLLSGRGSGSEFPDRECCDSAPPPPPHYHTVTSTSTSTTTTTPQPPTYGKLTVPLKAANPRSSAHYVHFNNHTLIP